MLITIYGIAQITTSLNPVTASYSNFSLLILAFLAIVILIAGHKQPINSRIDSIKLITEWIGEFKEELKYKMNETGNNKQKAIYQLLTKEYDIRMRTFQTALKYAKKQKE